MFLDFREVKEGYIKKCVLCIASFKYMFSCESFKDDCVVFEIKWLLYQLILW